MMYKTQNQWISGLCASSGTLTNKKTQFSSKLSVFSVMSIGWIFFIIFPSTCFVCAAQWSFYVLHCCHARKRALALQNRPEERKEYLSELFAEFGDSGPWKTSEFLFLVQSYLPVLEKFHVHKIVHTQPGMTVLQIRYS